MLDFLKSKMPWSKPKSLEADVAAFNKDRDKFDSENKPNYINEDDNQTLDTDIIDYSQSVQDQDDKPYNPN